MSKSSNYNGLKAKLKENKEWPMVFFFKFIIPADNQKLALVEALFGPEAEVRIKQSNKGNYLSIGAKELMLDAESIVDRYRKASKIEGLMAL
ncbi:MAG: hypothetical protein CMO34_01500 [Verrucomicrobia bacterium]|nr:hypothetical protein [Verrucomicrobiota bacterium]|tara:strand:+ start:916 stop:1191 length:276 start_codon:yes stop_codon:yes gene_type:complete